MRFKVTKENPDDWVLYLWEQGFFKSKWVWHGTYRNETDALHEMKRLAEHKPHTSFYDRHGNLIVDETDW